MGQNPADKGEPVVSTPADTSLTRGNERGATLGHEALTSLVNLKLPFAATPEKSTDRSVRAMLSGFSLTADDGEDERARTAKDV
jgi:hypothetical protein